MLPEGVRFVSRETRGPAIARRGLEIFVDAAVQELSVARTHLLAASSTGIREALVGAA